MLKPITEQVNLMLAGAAKTGPRVPVGLATHPAEGAGSGAGVCLVTVADTVIPLRGNAEDPNALVHIALCVMTRDEVFELLKLCTEYLNDAPKA